MAGYITLFGEAGIRFGVHGVFTIMPAILFGPWYGAVVSGLGDVLGHFLRPSGAYLPQMTLVAIAGGFLRGWMWRLVRGRGVANTRMAVAFVVITLLLFGGYSFARLRHDGVNSNLFVEREARFYEQGVEPEPVDTSGMWVMSRMLIERAEAATYPTTPTRMLTSRIIEITVAPVVGGVFGLALLGVDLIFSKHMMKDKEQKTFAPWNGSIMPLALTILIISLLINFVNTLILMVTLFPGWQALPFTVVWLPRALGAMLIGVVNVYIAAVLLGICKKQPHMKELIE